MRTAAVRAEPDAALTAYRRDGYLVIRDLFTKDALAPVLDDMAEVFRLRAAALGLDLPARTDHAGFGDLAHGLFQKDIPSYIAAAKLTQHLASVHALGLSPPVMQVLQQLGLGLPAISTRPVIHYMADQLKIPGGYQKTPTHQDWRSVQGSLDGVTFWAPAFDVGPSDYPLEIIPGSHRRGLLPTTPDQPNERILDDLYEPESFRALELRAGDAVVFSGFLVHRTGARGGEAVRVSFSFRFNNAAEPRFSARNYPNPYLYRADPAIVSPGFAGPGDVEEVFGP